MPNRLCLVDHRDIEANEPTVECPKCHVPYHPPCWEFMAGKCANQICAWGRICPVDQLAIPEGEQGASCPKCGTEYHRRCWNEGSPCARSGCAGKPKPTGPALALFQAFHSIEIKELWPCGHEKKAGASVCWRCEKTATAPAGEPPRTVAPGDVNVGCVVISFIIGGFFGGVWLGAQMLGNGEFNLFIGAGLAAVAGFIGYLLAKKAQANMDALKPKTGIQPKPGKAMELLQRALDRLGSGDRLAAEADTTAVLAIEPNSSDALLLRSLARYGADNEASFLDLRQAKKNSPRTMEGYGLLLTLDLLYWHLSVVLAVTKVGARFELPQTSLTLGAESILAGDYAGAERMFRSVLDHPGDGPYAALGLGLVRFWKSEYDEAIRAIRDVSIPSEHLAKFISYLRMKA